MKRLLMIATTFACPHAYAWTTTPAPSPWASATATQGQGQTQSLVNSNTARSAATSRSASSAQSVSSPRVTNTVAVTVQQPATNANRGAGYATGGQQQRGGTSYYSTTAPNAFAPAIVGGSPCTVGLSLGGAGQAAAGAAGFTWESHDCALRQEAAMLINAGLLTQGIEALCRTGNEFRWAMYNAGTPCTEDGGGSWQWQQWRTVPSERQVRRRQ